MARYDIRDFDIGSVLSSVQQLKSRNNRSDFRRMLPTLFEGFVGVYDRYQEDKIKDLIDEKNFENTLALGKLRSDAAKQAKIYKETQPVYEDLLKAGVSFTGELEQGTDNFRKVERALGENALDTLASQYGPNSRLGDKDIFKNFDDVKKNAKVYLDLNDEELSDIEANYIGLLKDEYNRVKTGQSFDYDAFNQAQDELSRLQIDPEIAKSGLLSKLTGKVQRRIEAKDRKIDSFRDNYVATPVQNAVNAFKVFENSKSGEEYDLGMFEKNPGYLQYLPVDSLKKLTGLPTFVKKRVSHIMQTDLKNEESLNEQSVNNAFNRALYGATNPSEGLKVLFNRKSYKNSQLNHQFQAGDISEEDFLNGVNVNNAAYDRQVELFQQFTGPDAQNYIKLRDIANTFPEGSRERVLIEKALDARMFDVGDKLFLKYIDDEYTKGEISELKQNYIQPGEAFTSRNVAQIQNQYPRLTQNTLDYLNRIAVEDKGEPTMGSSEYATNRGIFDGSVRSHLAAFSYRDEDSNKDKIIRNAILQGKKDNSNLEDFKNSLVHEIKILSSSDYNRKLNGLEPLFDNFYTEKKLLNEVMPRMVFDEKAEGIFHKYDKDKKLVLLSSALDRQFIYEKLLETIKDIEADEEFIGSNQTIKKDNETGMFSFISSIFANDQDVEDVQQDFAEALANKEDPIKLNQGLKNSGFSYVDGNVTLIQDPETIDSMSELSAYLEAGERQKLKARRDMVQKAVDRGFTKFLSVDAEKTLEDLNKELTPQNTGTAMGRALTTKYRNLNDQNTSEFKADIKQIINVVNKAGKEDGKKVADEAVKIWLDFVKVS